jgi:VWFA-related protein
VSSPNQSSAVTILLFDLLNTATSNQLVARKQMLKFLQELPPGRPVSVFTLTDHLQMIQSFTGSPDLLTAAAEMLKPFDLHHMPSQEEVQEDQNRAREFDRQGGGGGRSLGSSAVDSTVQTQDSDLDLRAYNTIAALTQLAQMMGGYQGRKNLYWVSESFPIALNTTKAGWSQTLPVDVERMTNLLAGARIAVYPVSVLGLDLGPSSIAFSGIAANLPDFKVPFMGRGTLKGTMNTIADQTGGESIVGTNDLAGAMQRSLDNDANYYTLAYQPQNRKWNKKFRNIRVELTQKGDSLAYRRGYFAYPDNPSTQNPAQELNAALQLGTPESTMLALQSKVDLPSAQHPSILVHSVLNPASLNLVPAADGHRRDQLLVMLVAFSENPAKPNTQPEAPPQTSGVLNLDLNPAQYQTILKDGVAFTQQLQLPPGRYRLRLGVSDLTTHRLGTLDMPIAIAAQTAKN